MTLNRVDLPQPDGPITDRNSPGLTLKETSSTAITGPSAVSKRTPISSATRMASSGDVFCAAIADLLSCHHRGHRGSVAWFHAHIDNRHVAFFDRGDGFGKCGLELADGVHRPEALRPLRARDGRDVDIGLGNALAD